MTPEESISIEEVKACLNRSGYLMESRLVRLLSDAGFFVEPNVAHQDPRTGKAREIDLVAEDAHGSYYYGACVKTTFVIEAINNRFPIVLLTERPSTPNADFESYIKFACTPEPCSFLNEFSVYDEKNVDWHNLFSQYCALTKKSGRDEFMASHPDDMHSSLLKLAEYAEDELSHFQEWTSEQEGEYWRLVFWQPILVVSGQLMSAKVGTDGTIQLQEVPLARLEFNWHDEDVRRTTVIEVIREDFLLERLNAVREHDGRSAERMAAFVANMKAGKSATGS
jgi:hypothetical protein